MLKPLEHIFAITSGKDDEIIISALAKTEAYIEKRDKDTDLKSGSSVMLKKAYASSLC